MAETWPHDLPAFLTPRKTGQSASAGPALDGSEMAVSSAGGYWTVTGTVKVHRERALSWRALYAALDGRSGRVLVPIISRDRPTDMNGRLVPIAAGNGIGWGRGRQNLGDGGGLGYRETPIMWTLGPSALRATQIAVSHPHVAPLRPGHYFGIGERLYLVARCWLIERERLIHATGNRLRFNGIGLEYDGNDLIYGEASPASRSGTNTAIVEFWPPLREDVGGGTPLILGRPVCRMHLANDDTGVLDMGESRYGEVAVEFTEAS